MDGRRKSLDLLSAVQSLTRLTRPTVGCSEAGCDDLDPDTTGFGDLGCDKSEFGELWCDKTGFRLGELGYGYDKAKLANSKTSLVDLECDKTGLGELGCGKSGLGKPTDSDTLTNSYIIQRRKPKEGRQRISGDCPDFKNCKTKPHTKSITLVKNADHSIGSKTDRVTKPEEAYKPAPALRLKIRRSTFTNAIANTRRCIGGLFNRGINLSEDEHTKPSSTTSVYTHNTVTEKTNLINCDNSSDIINLSNSSSNSDSNSETDSFVEFEHDLKFLSKCANMTSSPNNRQLKEESTPETNQFDLLLPQPDAITRVMHSLINRGTTTYRHQSPLALSPLAKSIHRLDIDIQNGVTRMSPLPSKLGFPLRHSSSSLKFSEREWSPFGPAFSTPVRRCLSLYQSSLPVATGTDAAKNQSGDTSPTGTETEKRKHPRQFRNEDEEAVYYLILKYLQKEETLC